MSTECTQTSFVFEPHGRREVVACCDGDAITSDAGALLLRQVDQQLDLLPRLAACFDDRRNPQRIEHSVEQLVSQRVYALALGYEDLNDHDELRSDPLLALLAGKTDLEGRERKREQDRGKPLAGKSTLNRLERSTESPDRYKKIRCDFDRVDRLLRELLDERLRSSRGMRRPRGVKRKMSGYPLRPRGALPRERLNYDTLIRIIK